MSVRMIAAIFTPAFLAACLAGCTTQARELDLSLHKTSAGGRYQVTLVPPQTLPAINQLHSWQVVLADPSGTPVPGARFSVDGGMPQHGHGLPTQPRVTRETGAGTYRIDGMKFSMTGWWELALAIDSPLGPDQVRFNTMVTRPSASQ